MAEKLKQVKRGNNFYTEDSLARIEDSHESDRDWSVKGGRKKQLECLSELGTVWCSPVKVDVLFTFNSYCHLKMALPSSQI